MRLRKLQPRMRRLAAARFPVRVRAQGEMAEMQHQSAESQRQQESTRAPTAPPAPSGAYGGELADEGTKRRRTGQGQASQQHQRRQERARRARRRPAGGCCAYPAAGSSCRRPETWRTCQSMIQQMQQRGEQSQACPSPRRR